MPADTCQSDAPALPLLAHLRELRRRLLLSLLSTLCLAGVAYAGYDRLVAVLLQPFRSVALPHQFYMPNFFDPFLLRVKVALVGGAVMALPIVGFHVVHFLSPALKPAEKRGLAVMLGIGTGLAVASVYFTYFWILPFSLQFLMSRDFVPPEVTLLLNLGDNLYYLALFLLCTAAVFQIPLLLGVLMYLGVLKRRTLLRYGRFIVVLIFIVAAIITPPEMISQCCVAIPLVALFYLTILVAWVFRFGE